MKRLFIAVLFLIIALPFLGIHGFAQSAAREEVFKQIKAKRAELQLLEDQLLAPSQEDRAAYTEFLSQSDTGLIRLLPSDVYNSEEYRKTNKTPTISGGGACYSFTHSTHEYDNSSDLALNSGSFAVGFAGANYGMLVNVGDLPLEQIMLEHPSVRFLAAYAPAANLPNARTEQQQVGKGFTVDDQRYQNRQPVEVKSTYILRSINYSTSDVLVAFKVIRKDTDGSVIILWKLLKKYPVPELVRAK
ncbi:MAG TPA: hypothetical protein VMS31_13150 [Pyrinomonadaceae bacterium]|nr:hypothetical protein [Pyrinomonadaceae bacterium]